MKKILLLLIIICSLLIVNCVNAQFTKIFDFNVNDGTNPYGSLIYDGTYLYGMTLMGGSNYEGVVFKIKPDGIGYTVLLDFNGTNGEGSKVLLFMMELIFMECHHGVERIQMD